MLDYVTLFNPVSQEQRTVPRKYVLSKYLLNG